MAVTIKDVAAAAGVSPSTVSRTCKDSPSISRETKERVRRIMAQLGYEPNFEAEPVEAFSKTIGIILPSSQRDVYENAFHLEIIRGIGQFCNQRRYVNTVITGQDDAEVLDAIQSMVANAQADGFILLYSKKDCPVAAYLRNEGLLHVIVGKAAQSANQTIYIDNDNALAGEEATDYLYEMGHRRIAYFGVSYAVFRRAQAGLPDVPPQARHHPARRGLCGGQHPERCLRGSAESSAHRPESPHRHAGQR